MTQTRKKLSASFITQQALTNPISPAKPRMAFSPNVKIFPDVVIDDSSEGFNAEADFVVSSSCKEFVVVSTPDGSIFGS